MDDLGSIAVTHHDDRLIIIIPNHTSSLEVLSYPPNLYQDDSWASKPPRSSVLEVSSHLMNLIFASCNGFLWNPWACVCLVYSPDDGKVVVCGSVRVNPQFEKGKQLIRLISPMVYLDASDWNTGHTLSPDALSIVIMKPSRDSPLKVTLVPQLDSNKWDKEITEKLLAKSSFWVCDGCHIRIPKDGSITALTVTARLPPTSSHLPEFFRLQEFEIANRGIQTDAEQARPFSAYYNELVHQRLNELVLPNQEHIRIAQSLKVRPIRGILFHGPAKTGKASAIFGLQSSPTNCHVITVDCGALLSRDRVDLTMQTIRDAFAEAAKTQQKMKRRVVIFFQDIDLVGVKRAANPVDSASYSTFQYNTAGMSRIVALLLTMMDGANEAKGKPLDSDAMKPLIVGTSSHPENLDPAFRRPGRFDVEIYVPLPTYAERYDMVMSWYEQEHCKAAEDSNAIGLIRNIAKAASAFGGGEMRELWDQASTQSGDTNILEKYLAVCTNYTPLLLRTTLAHSRMADIGEPSDSAKLWSQVAGYHDIKKRLQWIVEWPFTHRDTFQRLHIRPSRGVVLHGEPGCSKTSLVRVISQILLVPFFEISGADVYSCYFGEAEKMLQQLFRTARTCAPCVIFIDEIDAIVGKRGVQAGSSGASSMEQRVLSTLLNEMDGIVGASSSIDQHILVLAATNRIDLVDDALLRPGRFDDVIYIRKPNEVDRRDIIELVLGDLKIDSEAMERSVDVTRDMSGAEISTLVREAKRHVQAGEMMTQAHIYRVL